MAFVPGVIVPEPGQRRSYFHTGLASQTHASAKTASMHQYYHLRSHVAPTVLAASYSHLLPFSRRAGFQPMLRFPEVRIGAIELRVLGGILSDGRATFFGYL